MGTPVTQFNSWMRYMARVMRGELTAPDSTKFYLLLTNGLPLTRTTTLATIASNEVSIIGYARTAVDVVAAGVVTYNGSTNRAEYPTLNLNLTAGAASIQYDGIVLLANGLSAVADSTGDECWFINTSLTTIPASGSQTVAIENWGYANIGTASGT